MTAPPPGGAAGSGDGPRFAVVGAYVIDCIARTDRMPEWGESYQGESVHMAPGGKALNMAVALARMGAHVDAIGVVGDDLAGQTVIDALVRQGVGIEALEVRPGARTPICVCFSRNTDGEPAFLWKIDDNVGMDASTIRGAGRGPLEAADATIVTFECPAAVSEAIALTKLAGGRVILNPAPSNPSIDPTLLPWADVDVLVPNVDEARALLRALNREPASAAQLAGSLAKATGISIVIVTMGASGVTIHTSDFHQHRRTPEVGEVLDSTGASDAFIASLAFDTLTEGSLAVAVDRAQLAAIEMLRAVGGYAPPGLPAL